MPVRIVSSYSAIPKNLKISQNAKDTFIASYGNRNPEATIKWESDNKFLISFRDKSFVRYVDTDGKLYVPRSSDEPFAQKLNTASQEKLKKDITTAQYSVSVESLKKTCTDAYAEEYLSLDTNLKTFLISPIVLLLHETQATGSIGINSNTVLTAIKCSSSAFQSALSAFQDDDPTMKELFDLELDSEESDSAIALVSTSHVMDYSSAKDIATEKMKKSGTEFDTQSLHPDKKASNELKVKVNSKWVTKHVNMSGAIVPKSILSRNSKLTQPISPGANVVALATLVDGVTTQGLRRAAEACFPFISENARRVLCRMTSGAIARMGDVKPISLSQRDVLVGLKSSFIAVGAASVQYKFNSFKEPPSSITDKVFTIGGPSSEFGSSTATNPMSLSTSAPIFLPRAPESTVSSEVQNNA